MKQKIILAAIALLGIMVTFGAGTSGAQDSESSSCTNCHSDLEKMDSYGAAAASGGAAIAG